MTTDTPIAPEPHDIAARSIGAVGLAASAAVGFTLTRTVGLPQAHGDIGNWSEPLGMASLFVEGCVIALTGLVTAPRLRRAERRHSGRAIVGA